MPESNPPSKHHYIPAFYLKRWAVDGKVLEFTKPWDRIIVKPIAPERTGFMDGLYELKGFDPQLAQQVETSFFKPVDTLASSALNLLEQHGEHAPWDSESRSAWTRFILSLLIRCPEDISLLRDWWQEDFSRTDLEAEARYRAVRGPDVPDTFSEYLATRPLAEREKHMFAVLSALVDNDGLGEKINAMHWRVLNLTSDMPGFLTSDRPIIHTNGIGQKRGHIGLPIGPRSFFIASNDAEFLQGVAVAQRLKLDKESNRQVVEGTARFVYGQDQRQLRFIENRFGKSPQSRIMERIAGKE